MSDERVAELERTFKESGSAADWSAWQAARVRAGLLSGIPCEVCFGRGWLSSWGASMMGCTGCAGEGRMSTRTALVLLAQIGYRGAADVVGCERCGGVEIPTPDIVRVPELSAACSVCLGRLCEARGNEFGAERVRIAVTPRARMFCLAWAGPEPARQILLAVANIAVGRPTRTTRTGTETLQGERIRQVITWAARPDRRELPVVYEYDPDDPFDPAARSTPALMLAELVRVTDLVRSDAEDPNLIRQAKEISERLLNLASGLAEGRVVDVFEVAAEAVLALHEGRARPPALVDLVRS